ncbi:MAG: hypothetical protein CL941_05190 [Desulfobacter sp.]|nr:hypothetical protein [Desulfobacter sp.]
MPRGVEAFELITIKKDKEKYFGEKSCSSKSALTAAQNFLRVSIPEATDFTNKHKPSRACAWLITL